MTSPAPLRLRLADLLVSCGGVLTRDDLVGYLANLFGASREHVADVLLEEVAAGAVVIPLATAGRQTVMTADAFELVGKAV